MTEAEFLEAAKFLPKLPRSNLDDRTFEDLVQECLLRIPRYCPEWTNYNPGDPGVTLVELFSWLVHQMLFRFNQVPRRNYVAFLELLGIRLQPPTPALTELTFYLSKEQFVPVHILPGTEVATVRTENQQAIVFSTQAELVIGQPSIRHVLRSPSVMNLSPEALGYENLFTDTDHERSYQWQRLERDLALFPAAQSGGCLPGSCVYFVLDADMPTPTTRRRSGETVGELIRGDLEEITAEEIMPEETGFSGIEGNVLALKFRGPAAVTTGINPLHPPLRWEVWNGEAWVAGILRKPTDDHTKGFSFDQLSQEAGPNPEREGADVLLHLPQSWPKVAHESGYSGHWIRCVYVEPQVEQQQFPYQRSPMISGLEVRSLGGTITASECIQIKEEFLGVSNGKPGQSFELEGRPVLTRTPAECIEIVMPSGAREIWHEAADFGDARQSDRCYTLNSLDGTVQFGPLIKEPYQVRQQTHERGQIQSWGRARPREIETSLPTLPAVLDDEDRRNERQYGAVPPLGAEIYMRCYRTGGGSRGNVQARSLTVLKTAIPYVKQVINYVPAMGGTDAESLDQAVLRAPAILRSRQVAITPEDFESTARRFRGTRFMHRAHCVSDPALTVPGQVRLLVVPSLGEAELNFTQGIAPEQLQLSGPLHQDLQSYLDQHKALGIQVKLETPKYVGVQVQAQVFLQTQYAQAADHSRVEQQLQAVLYTFLNPLTGSFEKQGWPLGRSVRTSDVIALLQDQPEVRFVGSVTLFSLRQYEQEQEQIWLKSTAPAEEITLSSLETVCSWADLPEGSRSASPRSASPRSDSTPTRASSMPLASHHISFMN
ncbi:MAG: putative baseplate assembly protein [Cyanobacteria bacterium J06560_2]